MWAGAGGSKNISLGREGERQREREALVVVEFLSPFTQSPNIPYLLKERIYDMQIGRRHELEGERELVCIEMDHGRINKLTLDVRDRQLSSFVSF